MPFECKNIEESLRAIDTLGAGLGVGRSGPDVEEAWRELDRLRREINRLSGLLWSPENENFTVGVIREAGHQVDRWGSDHDAGKDPQDWFWLIGYLSGKALRAAIDGDIEKAQHHCISTAAVCANWHRHISDS